VEEGEEADAGPREPTLLLDEVVPLVDAIRAETRGVHIRLNAARHQPELLLALRAVLDDAQGGCPVQLSIELEGGAEAVLALRDVRVEPSDAMLSRVEKLLGPRVVELR
jgi:DNA polymerase-3 subunit alpha